MEQFLSSRTQRKSQEPGRRDLREMGVIGKWWKGEKRSVKEMEERKRKVIVNGAEGKQCQE